VIAPLAGTVERPRSLAAALDALAPGPAPARLLAGGTDLMVEVHAGRSRPERVVDLSLVAELRGIRRGAAGTWIGAATTCTDLLADAELARELPLLRDVALQFAAPQIRNRATVGGNLATASPAGDLAPALLVLDAVVHLRSLRGAREVPLAAFFTGYRRHAGAPDELIEAVFVPARPAGERAAFAKAGTRAAQSIAKVNVALSMVARDGRIDRLAGAAGAVADRPVRLPSLQTLVGTAPSPPALLAAATAAARSDCAPIDDVRSTAQYRRHALQRLLAALLAALLREA